MSDYEDSYEYMVDEALAGKRKLDEAAAPHEVEWLRPFVTDIAALNVDALSPIDALTKLYELQRKAAQQLFSKVMDAGAEKHGIQWLAFHMAIHDLVDQEYLPEAPNGDSDPRVRALIAEIADAILSKYKLVPR